MDLASALDPSRSGGRLRVKDDLEAAEKTADLALHPLRANLLEAQAEHQLASAGKASSEQQKVEAELGVQQRLMQNLAQGGGGEATDPADQLDVLARAALGAGAFNVGGQAAQRAAAIRASQASQGSAAALSAQRKAAADLKELEFAEGLYRDVKTPEGWNRAHMTYQAMRQKPSPFARMQYEPGLPQRLSQSMLSTKDALDLDLKKKANDLQTRNTAAREKTANARSEQLRAATEAIRQRIALVKKNGGTGAPELRELRETQTKLNKMRLAVNQGRTADNPATVVPPTADRKPGAFYTTPKGVMQWHPNGWIPAGQAMPPIGSVRDSASSYLSNLLGSDDDEDDDE